MPVLFKGRRSSLRNFLAWTIFFFVLFGAFLWVDHTLRPTIFKIAEVRAVQMATGAINRAVQQKIAAQNLQYQDFIHVRQDDQGHIVLMQANTVKLNEFSTEITLAVQSALQKLASDSFSIPLGQITGTQLLANLGPRVRVTIVPMGTVRVKVDDRFEQAGINQTRHTIYLDFNTEVRVVIPAQSTAVQVATQVPLVESIIVGQVPGTFVNIPGGIFSGALRQ
ncbi:sporulation protein YunB [Desulfotomaculum copahuensis]|uniref:sporulation protein YunB n=1 Tax=Desulfotomaculum copahuensis TaxID=1838280 RepID=UPI001FA7B70A|nr:sporulation protein YunB [Desulfotomaculum copahuensis]